MGAVYDPHIIGCTVRKAATSAVAVVWPPLPVITVTPRRVIYCVDFSCNPFFHVPREYAITLCHRFPSFFYPLHPFLEQHREFFGRKMSISRRVSKYLYHNDSFDYWYLAWNKFLNSKVFQIYNCEFLLLKIMKLD